MEIALRLFAIALITVMIAIDMWLIGSLLARFLGAG